MKVGDIVVPSSNWLSQAFYNADEFGVGLIIKEVKEEDLTIYRIMWSAEGVFNSWEYDFELDVISESQ